MIATRSPFRTDVTSGPVATTSPENSWPRICGFVAPVSGCGSTGVTIWTGDIFMQVNEKIPQLEDPNYDLAWAWFLRLADVLDPEITGIVETKRAHYAPRLDGDCCLTVTARSVSVRSTVRRALETTTACRECALNPRRRLRPMSVNVSIVLPRSASVCHQEASLVDIGVAQTMALRTSSGQTSLASAI